MEVHHPHHVTHKKKWGEYLLEFFMLFLAIFLGFLAENFREHQDEKERAKQYIESFYEDLKIDTSRITAHIAFENEKLAAFAGIGDCYRKVMHNENAQSCLLNLIKNSSLFHPFKSTERTLDQLLHAGGFRLLSKKDGDSIIAYQADYENFLDYQNTIYQTAQNEVRATFNQLITFSAHYQMFHPEKNRVLSAMSDSDVTAPVLFANNKVLLNQYFNEMELYYRASYNEKIRLLHLKDVQTRLIGYLKKEYYLQ